jgi:hypothetical protein
MARIWAAAQRLRCRGFVGSCLVDHHHYGPPAAQLIAMHDDQGGICNQRGIDVGWDDVVAVPQHKCPIAVIGEFLLELSQRALRAREETFHEMAGFMLDQEAHRQGDQKLPSSSFGGVERAFPLDGKDSLLDLMR